MKKHHPNKIWRIGTLNIQAGLKTNKFGDYVTKSWHHVTPVGDKKKNIHATVPHIQHLDVFGVQELDPGSWRSAFVDQTRWLAEQAGFPYWSQQANRNLKLSITANAVLAKHPLFDTEHWTLPGKDQKDSPRGAIKTSLGPFTCVVAHFSLSSKDRLAQSSFLAERLKDEPNLIIMGDFNATPDSKDLKPLAQLMDDCTLHPTYPRWKPQKPIDVMWWRGLDVIEQSVHQWGVSDHCGLEVAVRMPKTQKD